QRRVGEMRAEQAGEQEIEAVAQRRADSATQEDDQETHHALHRAARERRPAADRTRPRRLLNATGVISPCRKARAVIGGTPSPSAANLSAGPTRVKFGGSTRQPAGQRGSSRHPAALRSAGAD